eukprot:COSAG04_NODE_23238_length_341_cov_1.268595_2_plen_58_part_00
MGTPLRAEPPWLLLGIRHEIVDPIRALAQTLPGGSPHTTRKRIMNVACGQGGQYIGL